MAVITSTRRCTAVVALFASLAAFVSPVVATETLSVMVVPSATVGSTFTTIEKLPEVAPPAITLLVVQVNDPVPPTAGGVQLQPAGGAMETNVVFAGMVSVRVMVPLVDCVLTFVTSC